MEPMMKSESYTPGHSQNAADFMAKRTLESHGAFFIPYLDRNATVLDCGCGPGTITLDIARCASSAEVVGVDIAQSQIDRATAAATQQGVPNATFRVADCYSLPFADCTFDRLFSLALMEHLADPVRALGEMHRVLKPGGIIGLCSPDWGSFVLAPPSPELTSAVAAYTALQSRNGGDVNAGRKLGTHLETVGFDHVQMSARYECYPSLEFIGEYLALQLDGKGDVGSANTLRVWSRHKAGMFAQAWVSAVARRVLPNSSESPGTSEILQ
jgi:SAM-dependent methyltransferase